MGISPLVQPLRRRQNMKRTLLTWLVLVIGLSLSSALPHPGVEQSGAKEMHPLSKMEPLPCPTDGPNVGLPKLMELGKGNYCSPYYYYCVGSEPILGRCFSDHSFDPVEETCPFTMVYCDMDKEEISEWNKPCQTDYLKFDFNANETRHHFCIYGNVFDPNTSHPFIPCVSLKETECSQDVCDYYWPTGDDQCESVSTTTNPYLTTDPSETTTHLTTDPSETTTDATTDTTTHSTTHPSTHPTTHPTTDATTRPTTPTVLTTTVEPDDDFVCPNGGDDLFGRPGHCNQFYLCKDGYPANIYLFNCPRGSEFDPSRKQCIPGAKFQC